jgi:hypothetical protein
MRISLLAASMILLSIAYSQAAPTAPAQQPLNCDVGPLEKTIAESTWLLYSCGDGSTLVLITPQGSKAFPFVFSLYRTATGYRVSGEGTGPKSATDPVAEALNALTPQNVATLIEQTKRVKK